MRKLVLRWAINAVAVYAAIMIVEGISAEGGWAAIFVVALILGLVNALIAPIIKLLTCPLIMLSLGLFTLVINAAMLLLVEAIAAQVGIGFYINDFWAALLGALVISVVSFVLSVFTGVNRDGHRRRGRR